MAMKEDRHRERANFNTAGDCMSVWLMGHRKNETGEVSMVISQCASVLMYLLYCKHLTML